MRVHANRRIVLGLLGLAALAACASAVLGPRSAAKPQTEPSACCSSPATSTTAASQDTAAADTQAQPADPPGTIDGAKNPELIPDEVAYRVLMIAVAEPENPTEEQKARARAKMRVANLSDADLAVFLTTASQFVAQIDAIASQAATIRGSLALVHPDSIEGRQLSELGKQESQVLVTTMAGLKTDLSIAGAEKLQEHVQSIKRKITIYPPPPNMPTF